MAKRKLSNELRDSLCEALRKGHYRETACALVGIHKDTFYEWIKKSENEERPDYEIYADFADAVKKAEAEAEDKALKVITDATPLNWQAGAWYLERKYPDRYGRRVAVDANVNHSFEQLLDDIEEE